MSISRVFIIITILLFGTIAALSLYKKKPAKAARSPQVASVAATPVVARAPVFDGKPIEVNLESFQPQKIASTQQTAEPKSTQATLQTPTELFEDVDNTALLFQKNSPLPYVTTVRYRTKAPWKPGKVAWLVDYASHYHTTLDFIARSLNGGRPDYAIQPVTEGTEFQVLHPEKEFSFFMGLDLHRCKLWLYIVDPKEKKCFLVKTYRVGLGRLDPTKESGALTPLGTYKLGSRVAAFTPKMMGMHRGKRVELIRVFGTRWIPFEREIGRCTEPAKGFGIHGTPWVNDEKTGQLVSSFLGIAKHESDGCVRLPQQDVEELYSIITTREATVSIVRDIQELELPFPALPFSAAPQIIGKQ